MSQMRTYSARTSAQLRYECDGCGAEIPPSTEVTMRQDGGMFCSMRCCNEADDAPINELRAKRAAVRA